MRPSGLLPPARRTPSRSVPLTHEERVCGARQISRAPLSLEILRVGEYDN